MVTSVQIVPHSTANHWLIKLAMDAKLFSSSAVSVSPTIATDRVWHILREAGVNEEALARRIANAYGLPIADLLHIDETTSRIIDITTARRFNIVPVQQTDHVLTVATADPFDREAEQVLGFLSGRRIEFQIASPLLIAKHLEFGTTYSLDGLVYDAFSRDDSLHHDEGADEDEYEVSDDQPVLVQLLNALLIRAIAERTSDIHIEPQRDVYQVRYRIDGLLEPRSKLPCAIAKRLLARLRIMTGMTIEKSFVPLDGRAQIRAGGRFIDLRVNIVPTMHGDKATIRVLDPVARPSITTLGFHEYELTRLLRLLDTRSGMVLVTGPTGSGKTTTLYGALDHMRNPGICVISVEDPVEYELQDITQIGICNDTGFTGVMALRAALRQDPDIIMVGEVRDRETAELVLQASETGHLVLSTLHTNNTVAAIHRLLSLGIDRSLLLHALRGVVAQRLVRKLCTHCAEDAPTEEIARVVDTGLRVPSGSRLRMAVGCSRCNNLGYFGRIAVAEILEINEEMRAALEECTSISALEELAVKHGLVTLRQSGLQHAYRGHTTLSEVSRVIEIEELRSTPEVQASNKRVDVTPIRPRALVVDDDESLREFVVVALSSLNFEIVQAEDGAVALSLIEKQPPFDLVITDLTMPRLDGFAFIKTLRDNICYAAIPIVVLTAAESEEAEKRSLALGADDYLRKPMNVEEIVKRINAAIKRTALR